MKIILFLVTSFLIDRCKAAASLNCFSHDGVLYQDSKYANQSNLPLVACHPNAVNSTCCFTNQACADDNLCHYNGQAYREYCTDKTWTSPACSPLCPSYDAAGVELTQCPSDGSFCCAANNVQCCQRGAGRRIDNSTGQLYTSTSSSAFVSTTTTSSTSSITSATITGPAKATGTTQPINSNLHQGLSTGALAGIVVAALLGVALIAFNVYYFCIRKRRKRAQNSAEFSLLDNNYYHKPVQDTDGYAMQDTKYHAQQHVQAELDASNAPVEMAGVQSAPHELDARETHRFMPFKPN